jgi:hypothetical protein
MNATKDIPVTHSIRNGVNREVVLYHGSGISDKLNIQAGTWFVDDPNSPLLAYYSNRGGQSRILSAKVDLGEILDLSMYNTDEMVCIDDAKSFLFDLLEDRSKVEKYIDHVFFDNSDAFDFDYDDNDNEIVAISVILNAVLKSENYKLSYDSIEIMEGDDNTTYCVLNPNKIKIF